MKKSFSIIVIISVMISLLFTGCNSSEKQLYEKLQEKTESLGMECESIIIYKSNRLNHYSFTCSNFEDFTYEEMLEKAKALYSISIAGKLYFLGTIYVGETKYTFYTSLNIVEKNGEEVYNDYEHSESHKSASSSSNSGKNTGIHTNAEAFTIAEYVVKENLKAPSTAKFCKITEATITYLGNDKYEVRGWVDAQNSYGAMIRQYFTVTYTAVKKGSDVGCTNTTCTFSD